MDHQQAVGPDKQMNVWLYMGLCVLTIFLIAMLMPPLAEALGGAAGATGIGLFFAKKIVENRYRNGGGIALFGFVSFLNTFVGREFGFVGSGEFFAATLIVATVIASIAFGIEVRVRGRKDQSVEGYKKCRECAEPIRVEARKCRYCGSQSI